MRKAKNYNINALIKQSAQKELIKSNSSSYLKRPQNEIKQFRAELKFLIVRSLKKRGKTNRRALSIKIGTRLLNYIKSYNIGKISIYYSFC